MINGYGYTFKNIRKNKKLTQEYVCNGIVTRTALSKFENNKNSITLDNFLRLLERLDMSLEEFIFINNDYKVSPFINIINGFCQLQSNHDTDKLINLIERCNEFLNEEDNWYIKKIKDICAGFIYSRDKSSEHLLIKFKEFAEQIWNELSLRDEWYYLDIRLINNLIFIFDQDTIKSICLEIDYKFRKYNNFSDYEILKSSLYLNMSIIFMKNDQSPVAKRLLLQVITYARKVKRYDLLFFSLGRVAIIEKDFFEFERISELAKQIDFDLYHAMIEELKELIEE